MMLDETKDDALRVELTHIYQQIMCLARQSRVTPSMARAWYTHVCAERVKRRLRCFSGSVSVIAANDPEQTLRLEHYLRIQTRLTNFGQSHLNDSLDDPAAFIQVLIECERVHIVTVKENYYAMRSNGG